MRSYNEPPGIEGAELWFFQVAPLPRALIRNLWREMIPRETGRSWTQWSCQFRGGQRVELPPVPATALHTVEKILKRGRIVPVDSTLEKAVLAHCLVDLPQFEDDWRVQLDNVASLRLSAPTWQTGFDSLEEQLFAETVLPSLSDVNVKAWLRRQVPFDQLRHSHGQNQTDQRLDFLLCHPSRLWRDLCIEIDGRQHQTASAQHWTDRRRDSALAKLGIKTLRIPAHEIRDGRGKHLESLRAQLNVFPGVCDPTVLNHPLAAAFLLLKRCYQLQVVLWRALTSGFLPLSAEKSALAIRVELERPMQLSIDAAVLEYALRSFRELLRAVFSMFNIEELVPDFNFVDTGADSDINVIFSGSDSSSSGLSACVTDVYVPLTLPGSFSPSESSATLTAQRSSCETVLNHVFGFQRFQEGQYEAIEKALSGRDSIVLLPTGAGKSVSFQLAGLLRPGLCLAVCPIISLMDDQRENLQAAGIDRVETISSDQDTSYRKNVQSEIATGEYLYLYVSPERFQNQVFRQSLKELTQTRAVALVAIDEAHCVSEWGHDFRPAYLHLGRILRDLCRDRHGVVPPLMALTGTASRAVLKDVQRDLQIMHFGSVITPESFDRKELNFTVISCKTSEKRAELVKLLRKIKNRGDTIQAELPNQTVPPAGIVFCPHVNRRYGVVEIAQHAEIQSGIPTAYYSGTPPKQTSKDEYNRLKQRNATAFKHDHLSLLVATKSFGMGIDKPNVRYTIHYNLPPSLEAFYQEAGRAGRDRHAAWNVILCSNDDPERNRRVLDPTNNVDAIAKLSENRHTADDDIKRISYFHAASFRGIDHDLGVIKALLNEFPTLPSSSEHICGFHSADFGESLRERALYRLVVLGVVSDYLKDYSKKCFIVSIADQSTEQIKSNLISFVATYQSQRARALADELAGISASDYKDFVLAVAQFLVEFVYEIIERSRRQGVREMLDACLAYSKSPDHFRQRLLDYLGSGSFTERVDAITSDEETAGLIAVAAMIDSVRSAADVRQARGAAARALEAYPDFPGLRLLRALTESLAEDCEQEIVLKNVRAAIQFAVHKYGLTEDATCDLCVDAAVTLEHVSPNTVRSLIMIIIGECSRPPDLARRLVNHTSPIAAEIALCSLMSELLQSVRHINRQHK